MRRFPLLLVLVAALVAPALALAASRMPGDGALSVQRLNGTIFIVGKGAVLGQFDRGKVTIEDPRPGDGGPAVFSGCERYRDLSDTKSMCSGADVRFRLIGGTFRVRVQGTGVSLSVAGKATVTMTGAGSTDDGTYSVNGGDTYRAVPPITTTLLIGAAANASP